VGCGQTGKQGPSAASQSPSSGSSAATTSTSSASPAAGLVIDIKIADGRATPTNATFEARVKEPITFRLTSDKEDELHVHSVPDHEFEVKAAPNQTFDFTVDVPGRVDVELHHLDVTVATINVR
jgi:hypothetical protein